MSAGRVYTDIQSISSYPVSQLEKKIYIKLDETTHICLNREQTQKLIQELSVELAVAGVKHWLDDIL